MEVPKSLSADYKEFTAYKLVIKCKKCNQESIEYHPDDFDDISIFRCISCGKQKWIPIYGDTYGLTDFGRFFDKKFNINSDKLINKAEFAPYFDAAFEAYCEFCECGGRFRRLNILTCYNCGSREVEVINSGNIDWRDNQNLFVPVKIEWLRYFKHPF